MRKFLLLPTLFILFSCAIEKSGSGELTDYLSEDASVILKLENPDLFFSNYSNNAFVQLNSPHPFFRNFEAGMRNLRSFNLNSRGYLSFFERRDSLSFTFITKELAPVGTRDSINGSNDLLSEEIIAHKVNGSTIYSTSRDSIYFLSDSRTNLQELDKLKNNSLTTREDFGRALRAASENHPVLFINHNRTSAFLPYFFPWAEFVAPEIFSRWTSLDLEIDQTALKFNGISTAGDSIASFINLFKDVPPARNELAQITPTGSHGVFSFTYRDFRKLKDNLNAYNQDQDQENSRENELLAVATEAGIIYSSEGEIFAVKHLGSEVQDIFMTEEVVEEFRGTTIYSYPSSGEFSRLLKPLASPENLQYVAVLQNFILFSEEIAALKEVISGVTNDRTLATTEAYIASFQSLSSEASLLLVNIYSGDEDENTQNKEAQPFSFTGFPVSALQFIYNGNFAHVHGIIDQNETTVTSQGVNQMISVSLDAPLANQPVFFRNHRTKGMDIAVQDTNNNLYLISSDGKINWKKQLDARILGAAQQVDILRNGRYQLAFATPNAVHVLDRDGNTVKPFPLKFRDDITQPLAIFDYDNKRDYRFVVVQDEEVFMYDNKGRSVKGFKFSRASEKITKSPKHIRIGKKDYILVAETSGKLNILSRTGETRVPVKEEIAFSDNEWYEYEGNFISTNEMGQLVRITENGKIVRDDLGLTDNHGLVATPKTLVTLSDNELTIKENKISLDFGLYTRPQIFYVNNKIYVGLTDTQAQRTFLFDSNGELIPGFPVYGTSRMDVANADDDPTPELVVQGEENSILIYELSQ